MICPELSTYTGTKDVLGSIDFYLNDNLRWGFELLVNGTGIGEHVKRGEIGGKYFSLGMKEYVVVDFRPDTPNSLKGITTFSNRITVIFKQDYSQCTYRYGTSASKIFTLMP